MLGMLAGCGALPIPQPAYEAAIRATGRMVDSNLAAFRAGADLVLDTGGRLPVDEAQEESPVKAPGSSFSGPSLDLLLKRVWADFPADIARLVETGVERVVDYQNLDYGRRYLDRLIPVLAAERAHAAPNIARDATSADAFAATRETARFLALWMTYEDIIKVADLKTRSDRFERVRAEVRAKADEPVQLTEFFKPGVEEVAALLPPGAGRRLMQLGEKRGWIGARHVRMRIRTHTITGFLRLWLLARLRGWRPRSFRFAEEQALIDRWLTAVVSGIRRAPLLGVEIAGCARLVKGYSDTHRRGLSAFHLVMDKVVDRVLNDGSNDGTGPVEAAAGSIRAARDAALADPSGLKLRDMIDRSFT